MPDSERLPVRKFTCDMCKETYTSGWTEEEAKAEYESIFGPNMGEEMAVLCDDCDVIFKDWYRKGGKVGSQ